MARYQVSMVAFTLAVNQGVDLIEEESVDEEEPQEWSNPLVLENILDRDDHEYHPLPIPFLGTTIWRKFDENIRNYKKI